MRPLRSVEAPELAKIRTWLRGSTSFVLVLGVEANPSPPSATETNETDVLS